MEEVKKWDEWEGGRGFRLKKWKVKHKRGEIEHLEHSVNEENRTQNVNTLYDERQKKTAVLVKTWI